MDRVTIFRQSVRKALPTTEHSPKISVFNISVWVYMMTEINRHISDDVRNEEYALAVHTICANGYPEKFLKTLNITTESILVETKAYTNSTEDTLRNKMFLTGIRGHNFCINLLCDLFTKIEEEGMNEPNTNS